MLNERVELDAYAGFAGWFTDRFPVRLGDMYTLAGVPLAGVIYMFPELLAGPARPENDPADDIREALAGVAGLESPVLGTPARAVLFRDGLEDGRRRLARGDPPGGTAGDGGVLATPPAGNSRAGDGLRRPRPALTRACMAA